jgi:hypothetical protein
MPPKTGSSSAVKTELCMHMNEEGAW